MTVRRSAAALAAATAVLCTAAAPAAFADDASPSASASPKVVIPSGLYGKTDPAYDGVWRQSLALLAQDTAKVTPAAKAVDWLTGQQCASGGFASFRADPAKACDAKTMLDTNATAAAVQALTALGGHDDTVKKSVDWLKSVAGKDGGWSYNPGGPSDANSTAVVIGALAAAGEKGETTDKAKDVLVSLSVPCDDATGAGAFAYQPDKSGKLYANAKATTGAVLGALGKQLNPSTGDKDPQGTGCEKATDPAGAAHNGAAYLAGQLSKAGYLKSAMPGSEKLPDYGNTADAVTALAADGLSGQLQSPLAWLKKNSATWAAQQGPAAYAQLIFAAHATGSDPRDFGGANLVEQLNATGPAPQTAAASSDSKKDSDGSGFSVWWIVGIGLVAGIGIGFLMSARGRKNQA
ncbi:prenyltransferase/squalene oxidase repeat-containing protein [Streptomyces beijiangensis]|uniref:Terpene cyclase/mutase family protein n=1 Tax=Streptomyces beijiangensis TaxID=163361 RepID=A0A939F4Z2_9ACTN|nr:prenyltransferase/squalene oxidase repeat-containing protein [Streptomyces beijiangensis]MBO0512661.1 terpene cyclase/mutase family protein [Streptomyces beijiangensis]